MTATALPEDYCVCVGEDGSPREIGRGDGAVTYKAMAYQSGQPVALQLIPLANVDETGRAQFEAKARAVRKLKHPNIARAFDVRIEDDHIVFATEYLQGETAEAWLVAHGPMPADAVLRIGLQVVSALAEAAFHSLSHRAIQPSNLMIVPGTAPDGGWPMVKLLNFGLAGLKLYSEGSDRRELTPSIAAAFASPEQLEKGKVDFRSEIFSLGATMCFLLTGAVPLARGAGSQRVLPSRVPIPRPVRRLLRHMLRINPEERPKDPLLFTEEIRRCLHKVERRRAISQRLGVPLAAEPRVKRPLGLAPILAGAAAVLLLLCAGLAAMLWPDSLRFWTQRERPLDSIGVPIGVPETPLPATANTSSTSPSPAAVAQNSRQAAPAAPTKSEHTPIRQSTAIAQARPSAAPSATVIARVESPEPNPGPVVGGVNAHGASTSSRSLAQNSTEPAPPAPGKTEQTPIPASTAIAQASPSASPSVTVVARVEAPEPSASATPSATAVAKVDSREPSRVPMAEDTAIEDLAELGSADASLNQRRAVAEKPNTAPPESGASAPAPSIANNPVAQVPPPAEAPPAATVAAAAQNPAASPAPAEEQQTAAETTLNGAPETALPSRPTPAKAGSARAKLANAKGSRAKSSATRHIAAQSSRDPTLPPLRVGTTEAQFVGTTGNGKWILQLPSGNTVLTPPVPKMDDAPVISHHKVRKLPSPPRALPADQLPPVVVLPPDSQ